MRQPSVLVLPGQQVPPLAALAGPYTKRGSTANFDVYYDNSLGTNGQNLADAVLAKCEQDFAQLQAWFGGINAGRFSVYIEPGSFGAFHNTCQDTAIHSAAFSGTNGDLVNFATVAEVDEVFMAVQNAGWACGGSNGEGLSRVLATELYPAQLSGFATAPDWLGGTDMSGNVRPDYVDVTDPTAGSSGGDLNHVGCATLFINWLRFQLGYNLGQIVQAAGTTLAATYQALTGRPDGFHNFLNLIAQHFPAGSSLGLTTDNPFPITPNPLTLYRCLNNSNGDHFYTVVASERDNANASLGYHSEDDACRIWNTQAQGMSPFHRLLNNGNGDHFYTASDSERDSAIANFGYHFEQVAGYLHFPRRLVSDPLRP